MIYAVLVTTLFCALQLALAMEQVPDEAAGAGHRPASERIIPHRTRDRFRFLSNLQPASNHQVPSDVVQAYYTPSRVLTRSQSVQVRAHRRGTARSRINLQSTTTSHAEGADHPQSLGAGVEQTSGSQGVRRLRQAIHQSRQDRTGGAAQSPLHEIVHPHPMRVEHLPLNLRNTLLHPEVTHTTPPHGHQSNPHMHIGFERQTRTAHDHPSGPSHSEAHHWALTMSDNSGGLHGESSTGPHAGHHAQELPPAGWHSTGITGPHADHHQQELPTHLSGVLHHLEHHTQEQLPASVHGESSSGNHPGHHHLQQLPLADLHGGSSSGPYHADHHHQQGLPSAMWHSESSEGPHTGHHFQELLPAGLHGASNMETFPGHHQQELPPHLSGLSHNIEHHHAQVPLPAGFHGESSSGLHGGHHQHEFLPAAYHGESGSGPHGIHHPQQHLARKFPDIDHYDHLLLDTASPALVGPPLHAHSQASSPAHTSTELPPLAPGTFREFALNHYPKYDSTSPPTSPLHKPKKPKPSVKRSYRQVKAQLRTQSKS